MEIPLGQAPVKRAPIVAMWICMVLGWIALVVPIPFTVFIGAPLAIIALILAIVSIKRGRKLQGIIGCIGSTVVSIIAYLIGLTVMTVLVAGGLHDEYVRRAGEAEQQVATATQVRAVPAATILADFAANRNDAIKKYDNHILDITGVVKSTGTDVMDYPFVAIAGNVSDPKAINCIFTADKNADISWATPGTPVTIRGKMDWMIEIRVIASRPVR
ncbi:MAG: hypothetical protein LIP23_03160 [Planctomycetes bacterium]|nr:hypothetical protein [Planctomycetota bacterium]